MLHKVVKVFGEGPRTRGGWQDPLHYQGSVDPLFVDFVYSTFKYFRAVVRLRLFCYVRVYYVS